MFLRPYSNAWLCQTTFLNTAQYLTISNLRYHYLLLFYSVLLLKTATIAFIELSLPLVWRMLLLNVVTTFIRIYYFLMRLLISRSELDSPVDVRGLFTPSHISHIGRFASVALRGQLLIAISSSSVGGKNFCLGRLKFVCHSPIIY